MPLTERDEILMKFAESQIIKDAGNDLVAYHLARELGIEAAMTGAGAAMAGGGAASLMTGGLATSFTGWGLPIGVLLVGAGIGMAIYSALNKTDNTINELIDRLEDLDYEGTVAERAIGSWITTLKAFKPRLSIPGLGSEAEIIDKSLKRVMTLKELIQVLTQMNTQWPQIKSAVQDWKFLGNFGDVGEAEVTLRQTLQGAEEMYASVLSDSQNKIKAVADKMQDKVNKKLEIFVPEAQGVLDLYDKLTDIAGGKAPSFDNESEKMGWEIANAIVKNKVTSGNLSMIQRNISHMSNLSKLMSDGLKQLGTKDEVTPVKVDKKESSNKHALSKRALTLGNGQKVLQKSKEILEPSTGPRKLTPKSRLVFAMQKIINDLLVKYSPGSNTIIEDGMYGPETGGTIAQLITGNKVVNRALTGAGFTAEDVRDYKKISVDQSKIRGLYSLLSNIASKDAGKIPNDPDPVKENKPLARSTRYYDMAELRNKHDPDDMEVDALLKEMVIHFNNRPSMSAYDYLRKRYGIESPSARADLIRHVFDKGSGLPASRWWIDSGYTLRKYMEDNYGGFTGKYNILFQGRS